MFDRTPLRFLSAAFVALAAVVATANPAAAHAELLGTEPGYGAVLPTGPDRVIIRYDLPVEVAGAQVALQHSGESVPVDRPVFASPDRRDVAIPMPELEDGSYVLTWFLFGSDGDVMGAELAFTVLPGASPASSGSDTPVPSPLSLQQPSFAPLARAQDAARLAASAGVTLLVGGVAFVAILWRPGARLRRTRVLLWAGLGGAVMANAAALGLKGAAVQGQSALAAFSPSALTALEGTHVGKVLSLRLGFLLLAVPVVALLTVAPRRALRSHRWAIGATLAGLGALGTHGMLSHAYARGSLAWATHVVHMAAVAVWLGGLAVLVLVVLPRRRRDELSDLVPRWSRLAFACVATAGVAGTLLLILISPQWAALPGSAYGRLLLVKLTLVALLLVAASRARRFAQRSLPTLTTISLPSPPVGPADTAEGADVRVAVAVGAGVIAEDGTAPAAGASTQAAGGSAGPAALVREAPGPADDATVDAVPLRPFMTAVTAELCLAASILAATAVLIGRPPPA